MTLANWMTLAAVAALTPVSALSAQTQTSEEKRNTEIVLEVFEALGSDNIETLERYFAVDGDVVIGLDTRKRGGPYETFRDAAAFPGSLDNVVIDVEHILAEGDKVAIQSRICGDHAEPLLGFEPTGKPLCARYINLYVLKDEKIINNSVSVYRDQLRDQLEANARG